MRVRTITPIHVDDAELARRQERYDRLAPAGWTIALENMPADGPRQLGEPSDVRASERILLDLSRTASRDEFDAIMPDCVLDPAVSELDAETPATVLGITRLGAHHLAALGLSFGVITRNETIGDEFTALMERYGLTGAYRGAFVLDLDVESISDDDAWNAAVAGAARRAREAGIEVLLNGCSAVEVDTSDTGVRIVDPIELAFAVARAGRESGLLR